MQILKNVYVYISRLLLYPVYWHGDIKINAILFVKEPVISA